jgi:hypothetical protein
MGKQLVNVITCGCELSAPFCNLQNRTRTHAVLVIDLYELLHQYHTPTSHTKTIKTPLGNQFYWTQKMAQ